MKDESYNKTVDWVGFEGNCGGRAKVVLTAIDVLLVIKNTGVATTTEVQDQVLKNSNRRTVQRYLKSLVDSGLLYVKSKNGDEYRYYLTGKAKQLFGVQG